MKCAACCLLALALSVPISAQTTASQLVNLRHWSGQGIAPVYEGFDINADGSCNMWFGYMNRNYEEELDIPVGADNTFEPGGDRGQPTHFTPRRHKDVFKVTVPKDFRHQTLVWKVTAHGQTQQVIATLARRCVSGSGQFQQSIKEAGGPVHRLLAVLAPQWSSLGRRFLSSDG